MKKIFISALLISSLSSVFAETINLESSQDSLIDTALIVSSRSYDKKEDILTKIGKSLKESFYFHYDKKTMLIIEKEEIKKYRIFIAYLDNNNKYIHISKCENCIVITRYFDKD
jgi:hypothetical protein